MGVPPEVTVVAADFPTAPHGVGIIEVGAFIAVDRVVMDVAGAWGSCKAGSTALTTR